MAGSTASTRQRSAAQAAANVDHAEQAESHIRAIVERQRAAHLAAGPASADQRVERIDRVIGMLVDNQREIVEAIASDFGHRSPDFSLMVDVLSPLNALKYARAHLAEWMRPQPRPTARGGDAWVSWQPLGVVGIMAPWNFPLALAFSPLAGVLAAGNRAVIKPSEYTPASAALMQRMVAAAFDAAELAVVTGDASVGAAFSRQRFDHLLFTGAASIGREVMREAAQQLVPVTLELGGKSPTIVSRTADLEDAARKIMCGKLHNAGQVCLSPDHVFVPHESVDAFVGAAQRAVAAMYPTLAHNPDYAAIINERHRRRLVGCLDEARRRGARVVELNAAGEAFDAASAKLAPALVIDPADDTKLMQDEIFGPILPIKPYGEIDEVVAHIAARPHPLGLYYFGADAREEALVLERTCSGGVTLGNVISHGGVEELPFGGVGASGMGAYRGRDGFRRFSHARAVYRSPAAGPDPLKPPYTESLRAMLRSMISR